MKGCLFTFLNRDAHNQSWSMIIWNNLIQMNFASGFASKFPHLGNSRRIHERGHSQFENLEEEWQHWHFGVRLRARTLRTRNHPRLTDENDWTWISDPGSPFNSESFVNIVARCFESWNNLALFQIPRKTQPFSPLKFYFFKLLNIITKF